MKSYDSLALLVIIVTVFGWAYRWDLIIYDKFRRVRTKRRVMKW